MLHALLRRMLRSCLRRDLRKDASEHWRSEPLPEGQALLIMSRAPVLPVANCDSLPIIEGPSAYYQLFFRECTPGTGLRGHAQAMRDFFPAYKQLVAAARRGERDCLCDAYAENLRAAMLLEETELYPRLSKFLGDSRLQRELQYEHDGIRRALGAWPTFLQDCIDKKLTQKQIDKFELDLYHLLEHHVEREEKSLYPLLERLCAEP